MADPRLPFNPADDNRALLAALDQLERDIDAMHNLGGFLLSAERVRTNGADYEELGSVVRGLGSAAANSFQRVWGLTVPPVPVKPARA